MVDGRGVVGTKLPLFERNVTFILGRPRIDEVPRSPAQAQPSTAATAARRPREVRRSRCEIYDESDIPPAEREQLQSHSQTRRETDELPAPPPRPSRRPVRPRACPHSPGLAIHRPEQRPTPLNAPPPGGPSRTPYSTIRRGRARATSSPTDAATSANAKVVLSNERNASAINGTPASRASR